MKELERFRQFLTEGQINENIDQIFIDTYQGYADGAEGDPNEIDDFTYEEEEMTDSEERTDDQIADFKAMQDYLRKNKKFVHFLPGYTDDLGIGGKFTYEDAKVVFTLEPNGKDILMKMGPVSKMDDSEEVK